MHRFAALPLQAFVNPVADDAAQPGAKFVRFAQEAEMFPCGNECFLGHVLALAEMADPAVGQRANQYLVARHNPAEGVPVARQGARNQFGVRGFFRNRCLIVCHSAGYVPAQTKEVTKNRGQLQDLRASGLSVVVPSNGCLPVSARRLGIMLSAGRE